VLLMIAASLALRRTPADPPDRTRAVQQFHPMLARADQLGVAIWRQGAALYLLTAELDEEGLARLCLKVRTHTS
jgi:hypothetical protein